MFKICLSVTKYLSIMPNLFIYNHLSIISHNLPIVVGLNFNIAVSPLFLF